MQATAELTCERIKEYLRITGPKDPEDLFEELKNLRLPGVIQFALWTMLFSGELHLNGFGEVALLKPDTREYLYDPIKVMPVADYRGKNGAIQRSNSFLDAPGSRGRAVAGGVFAR